MKHFVEPIRNKQDIVAIEKYLKSNIRNHLIWVFGTNTGLRISDILALNVEDVRNKKYIEIIEKKTKKYKCFPINNKLRNLIKKYLIERDKIYSLTKDEPLFLGKKHRRFNRVEAWKFITKACKELGIDVNVGTHTMRKTFGYHHYKQFQNVALLQQVFNHSSPSTTLSYIGIAQDEINENLMAFEL